MRSSLRFDIAGRQLVYDGAGRPRPLDPTELLTFNVRHRRVLGFYRLALAGASVLVLDDRVNGQSNLGVFRNPRLREAVVLGAALPAAAVMLDGFGSLGPSDLGDKGLINRLKRHNDRTAAQVMAEVLQLTTESFEPGDEVIIESVITEGVRAKPGLEPGGNPTIPVGALFGKEKDAIRYGRKPSPEVSRLALGSDVIDGTTKSVRGEHSALTALFLTETNFKRHLPDIYVERWMAGAPFPEFNPRDTDLREEAQLIARACGVGDLDRLTAFFLERERHLPALDALNALGVATPLDRDGDLFPALVMGLQGLHLPDGRGFHSMVGEIGGSAEWAISALPLVWRGGQSLGMLCSQSALTRKGVPPTQLWNERFSYTEEELILLSDARFEQKPYFTIHDLAEDPMAGGVSAFAAISDSCYLPALRGVQVDGARGTISVCVLVITSLGQTTCWELTFRCVEGLQETARRMRSPKVRLLETAAADIERQVEVMVDDELQRFRLRHFFVNEYYPALIHTNGKLVVLEKTIAGLIERGALSAHDRSIVTAVTEAASSWFIGPG